MDFYEDSISISIGTHELEFWISQMCIPSPWMCNWFSLVFINFYSFPLMFHGFNTSVSPASSGEVWWGLGSSREVWGAVDRSGEVWGSSGQVRGGLGSSGEVRAGLGSSGEARGGPGRSGELPRPPRTSGAGLPNHQILTPKPEKAEKAEKMLPKRCKLQWIWWNWLFFHVFSDQKKPKKPKKWAQNAVNYNEFSIFEVLLRKLDHEPSEGHELAQMLKSLYLQHLGFIFSAFSG